MRHVLAVGLLAKGTIDPSLIHDMHDYAADCASISHFRSIWGECECQLARLVVKVPGLFLDTAGKAGGGSFYNINL